MAFPMVLHGSFGQQFAETTTQKLRLGTRMFFSDGRRYVYCEMGGTVGVAGSLYQSEAVNTDYVNENATIAASQYATSVTVDVGAGGITTDLLKDGFLIDETNGHTYSIKSNTLTDPTVLTLNDPLETDIAVADTLSMFKSPFKDVIAKVAAAPTAPAVGVATQIIAANSYGWLQTYGLCAVLIEGTVKVGDKVVASDVDDAGAVAAAGQDQDMVIGNVLEIGVDQQIGTIFLTIG